MESHVEVAQYPELRPGTCPECSEKLEKLDKNHFAPAGVPPFPLLEPSFNRS